MTILTSLAAASACALDIDAPDPADESIASEELDLPPPPVCLDGAFERAGKGAGTTANPYLIERADILRRIAGHPGCMTRAFRLMADLDLAGQPFLGIGYKERFRGFNGTFDGNHHTIRNLTGCYGLFVEAAGTIRNLTLSAVNVNSLPASCAKRAGIGTGGLAGRLYWYAVVTNVSVTGTVTGNDDVGGVAGTTDPNSIIERSRFSGTVIGHSNRTGGIAGNADGTVVASHAAGRVAGSYFAVGGLVGELSGRAVRSSAAVTVSGLGQVGGLVGDLTRGSVEDSFSTGSVTATHRAGGLIGDLNLAGTCAGTVRRVFATGRVTITEAGLPVGGLVADLSYPSDVRCVSSAFWNTQTTGQRTSVVGAGRTTAQLTTPSTYAGWNFATIWAMTAGSYPRLR